MKESEAFVVSRAEQVTLARTLSYFDATMIGVGAMIGAGIFVLTGIAVGEAGPGALLAFALNGFVTLITAFTYAELASAIPEAGGGYAFTKHAFPGLLGFLSGWMLWFAYSVACSLYAVGFGGYFMELLHSYAAPISEFLLGLLGQKGAIVLVTFLISSVFVSLNVMGADVTGKAENIITMAKIVVLGIFAAFGVAAIFRDPALFSTNFTPFLPKGFGGVIVTMGLTFIAFEGYDLIATVSEEIKDPTRTIPKATFTSLAIAVVIYLLIVMVCLGAVDPTNFDDIFGRLPGELNLPSAQILDPADPAINTTWEILGIFKETGIVRAAENFMPAVGVLIIVFGGLLSTMSALNATVMASSRVAFSMGREAMLPRKLATIHPVRRTPQIAVLVTGLIFVLMAILLPIEVVGSAASVLFLLSFALVNAALIVLRYKEPDLKRGFKAPLFPWLPALGIVLNLALAIYQFAFQPLAWFVGLGWIAAGGVIYFVYTRARMVPQISVAVLAEKTITSREFTVMVPVNNPKQAHMLGFLGGIIAADQDGELLALHVVQVPTQLSLFEGQEYLSSGHKLIREVEQGATNMDIPMHSLLRLGRNVGEVIQMTVEEQDVNLLLMGWPGYSVKNNTPRNAIIDLIGINPPCDLAFVRFRKREAPRKILVATRGDFHAPLALKLARIQAQDYENFHDLTSTITLLQVISPDVGEMAKRRLFYRLRKLAQQHSVDAHITIATADDEYQAILEAAEEHDLVIVHAPEEGLLEQRLMGTIPQRLVRESSKTLMMVKRHHSIQSQLRRFLGVDRIGAQHSFE
jgi:amino acid transporter/nucleotide-binding universal stress UspA family protein